MNRKTICALFDDLDGKYNSLMWSEVYRAAMVSDINLIAFEGRGIDSPDNDRQHNIVYQLARRFACDGYLLFSNQITKSIKQPRFQEFCAPFLESGVPVVSVGVPLPGAISTRVDNTCGLRDLFDHLIVHHGYRRIAFVKGPDFQEEAEERFSIYREMLEKYGIPFDARLVQQGDFSPVCGYAAYERLHATRLPVDCIVCANDETASGAYQYLFDQRAKGIEPQTGFITGYDNIRSAQLSKPGFTTVAQPFAKIADETLSRLASANNLSNVDELVFQDELIIRESCGCQSSAEMEADNNPIHTQRGYRVHQDIQTFSLEELYIQLTSVLTVCGIGDCYIVKYTDPEANSDGMHVPESARLLYARVDGLCLPLNEQTAFPTDRLLPDHFFQENHRTTRIVKPLFFRDEHLGYMVFEPIDSDTRNYESVRGQISNTLKVALLLIRQKEIEDKLASAVNELQAFNQKLNLLSVRDELSGLYNRRGFFEAAAASLGKSENIAEDSLVIFADIDDMKKINDTYGHAEGDVAILTTTHILTSVFRGEDIVARMGGDEFVVLAKTLSESHFPIIQERIARMLQEYNRTSGKPYRLDFSLGHASFGVQKRPNLEELLKIADERLYIEKRRRRAITGEEQDEAIPF